MWISRSENYLLNVQAEIRQYLNYPVEINRRLFSVNGSAAEVRS